MSGQSGGIAPGLYFLATPIGNARDITLRALDLLRGVDVLVAEDTRTLRRLMEIHGLSPADRPVIAYHDHNGPAVRPRILAYLAAGRSVAYASEAGTPLVSDPGYALLRAAIEAGHPVQAAPGASAVLAALSVAGLPSDRFLFAGFLPPAQAARRTALAELAAVPATLVLFESPRRLAASLADIARVLGPDRQVAVCRELTKRFEEVLRGSAAGLAADLSTRSLKGEVVVLVDRDRAEAGVEDMRDALRNAMLTMSIKDAANAVAAAMNLPKRTVYQMALELKGGAD